jgi:hypothetical protein
MQRDFKWEELAVTRPGPSFVEEKIPDVTEADKLSTWN